MLFCVRMKMYMCIWIFNSIIFHGIKDVLDFEFPYQKVVSSLLPRCLIRFPSYFFHVLLRYENVHTGIVFLIRSYLMNLQLIYTKFNIFSIIEMPRRLMRGLRLFNFFLIFLNCHKFNLLNCTIYSWQKWKRCNGHLLE